MIILHKLFNGPKNKCFDLICQICRPGTAGPIIRAAAKQIEKYEDDRIFKRLEEIANGEEKP